MKMIQRLSFLPSGTTLRPKGVMLSNRQIMETMGEVADSMEWNENDRLLLVLPMYHGSGGNTGILVSLHSGMTLVLMRYYRSVPVMRMIEKYKCTVFNSVPSMLLLMMKNPKFGQYDLSSLKSGIISVQRYQQNSTKDCKCIRDEETDSGLWYDRGFYIEYHL